MRWRIYQASPTGVWGNEETTLTGGYADLHICCTHLLVLSRCHINELLMLFFIKNQVAFDVQ